MTNRRLRTWIPALLWMAVIFLFSGDFFAASNTGSWFEAFLSRFFPFLPEAWVSGLHLGARKSAHVFSYAILSVFYTLGLSGRWNPRRPHPRHGIGAAALSILYACTDEWHQSFSTARTGSAVDVAWDAFGAILAQVLLSL